MRSHALGYLVWGYLVGTAAVAVLLTTIQLLGTSRDFSQALPRALLAGGLLCAAAIYWAFHRHGNWPLYDNLRIPRLTLLALLFGGVQLLNLGVLLWLW